MADYAPRSLVASILVLLLLVGAVLGAVSTAAAQDGATHDVQVGDFFFAPPEVEVVVGDTVRWTQVGTRPHTVTADDGAFDSHPNCPPDCMGQGDTFEVTFTEPGEVGYYCKLHGSPGGVGQAGTVVVVPAPVCVDLIAGQSAVAGSVCVTNDGESLSVTYTTTGGWELATTHLHVADNQSAIPQTSSGQAQPGRFDHKTDHDGSVTSHTVTIALSDLGVEAGDELVLAAHADVERTEDDATQEEGAWADGEPFADPGSVATYFTYTVQ